ncbi:hypothetical protein [Owenweeksia hongkongensis]|uniref:hypothetical protein n=1 Tax=Owenweeksia hongkongensis TaxID=253245 RepID=UPI003A8C9EF8
MKPLLLLLSLFFLCSCGSDNLSNSKAEDIIEDCLEKEPLQQKARLQLNQARIEENDIEKYKKLADEGVIELEEIKAEKDSEENNVSDNNDPLEQWRREAEKRRNERIAPNYIIKLTSKGKKHITEGDANNDYVIVNIFKYVVDEVLEVQEFPAMNGAKVKVQYEADDITPFAVLSPRNPSELIIKDLTMKKTSNGWKYCDDY